MLLKGDRYAGMRVNFVSISIGGMIEGFNSIRTEDLLLERLFAIKDLAKIPLGSNYLIERIKLTATDSIKKEIENRFIYINEKDESLKYLLRTTLELQGYDVIEELDYDSNIQPKIIIDSGDDLSELKKLTNIKQLQIYTNTKIIVTSTTHDKTTILDAGADLYLPKPYEISDIIRWVEYFLK